MSQLLYIQASPRSERSHSIAVANAFVEAYTKAHPQDRIVTMNLFQEPIPTFDGLAVQAKYDIMHGRAKDPASAKVWSQVEKTIQQFTAADKYVLAVPMWNFGVPYRLKQYLDVIVQPGYTFTVSAAGYQGLVKGKPALVVYARGGQYSQGSGGEAYDLQSKYMDLILRFIGFEKIQGITVEPTLVGGPDAAKAAQDLAIQQARQLAAGF